MTPVWALTGPNWCHAALDDQTMVAILFYPGKGGGGGGGCKEWPGCGTGQRCPIWPPHRDWTVSLSEGGGGTTETRLSVPTPESKCHCECQREKERDGSRGGGVEGVCSAEHGQEGLRSSGKLTLMHQEEWATARCQSRQHGGNWAYSLLFRNSKTWMCSD